MASRWAPWSHRSFPAGQRSIELSSGVSLIHSDGREHRSVCIRNRSNAARRGTERWFLIAAGVASISFAFSFIAVGFFFRLEPPQLFFVWMSSYFVFCAAFMLCLAFRLYGRAVGQTGQMEPLSPLSSPRHAH
jgi:hypothetical protein